jgi:hypothetical protein
MTLYAGWLGLGLCALELRAAGDVYVIDDASVTPFYVASFVSPPVYADVRSVTLTE